MAEIIRSALQSVDPGQIEAAHALGMTYPQTLRRIILPEAFEVALPTLGNSFISIIKGTSLAFTCAVVEITAQGQIIGGRTYRYFEVYVSLAIIYWLVTLVIEQIIRVIENKIRIPDQVELASAKLIIYQKNITTTWCSTTSASRSNRAMLWESSVLPEPENQRFCAASTALRHRRRER